jgi:hypothetical protein
MGLVPFKDFEPYPEALEPAEVFFATTVSTSVFHSPQVGH